MSCETREISPSEDAGVPLSEERLQEIEQRANQATPGPWRHGRDDMQSYHASTGEAYTAVYADNSDGKLHMGHRLPFIVARAYDESGRNKPDARFIAHARADVTALLAEVRRLRALASVSPVPAPTPDAVQQAIGDATRKRDFYRRHLEATENATHPEIRNAAAGYRQRLAVYETIVAALNSLATPQPPREGEIHPDTARLDWMEQFGSARAGHVYSHEVAEWCGRFQWCNPGSWLMHNADGEQTEYVDADVSLREAIDAAMSATPEGR